MHTSSAPTTKVAPSGTGATTGSRSVPPPTTTTAGDSTVVLFVCCGNFVDSVLSVSLISYFFWVGVMYFVGATLLISGWSYSAVRVSGLYVCAATSNVFSLAGLWFFLALSFLGTCLGYASIPSGNGEDFEHFNMWMKTLGFFVKSWPTWARLVHLFNFCQLQVVFLDFLLIAECNVASGRLIIAIAIVIWWLIVAVGVVSKRRIFMPAYMYDPFRPGSGLLREIHKLLRAFGP
eukprot:GHVS01004520.1.p1 GENE.GHVS01004520.1~~GHVS01004520.1.p1  ORF type:complete len:275 (-),score=60.52 GHVS01004520.1:236-937(-)